MGFYYCVLLRNLSFQMSGITLNVNSLDGADELTSSTTHTEFGIGFGDCQSAFKRNHMESLNRAMLSACSATGPVHVYHADIFVEYHMAGLCDMFLLHGQGLDGTGGTYLAAQVAIIVAIALIKLHDRLHYASQSIFHAGRLKNVAGTFAHAQMAGGAVLQQVAVTP